MIGKDYVLAATLLDAFNGACQDFRQAARLEREHEAGRPKAKQAAILRLMQTVNPTTGGAEKLYSASAAQQVVELDSEYATYLARGRDLLVARLAAWDRRDTLRLQIMLELAQEAADALGR